MALPLLFVYDAKLQAIEQFALPPEAQTPYVTRFAFPVSAFLGSRTLGVGWTEKRALLALDALYDAFGGEFRVDRAFSRAFGAACSERAQHHTGLAFDLGATLLPHERARLRACCLSCGAFPYIEPPCIGGMSVHAALSAAYPAQLQKGAIGVYVFTLQASLSDKGFYFRALTGVLDDETLRALGKMRQAYGMPQSERVQRSDLLAAIDKAAAKCENN